MLQPRLPSSEIFIADDEECVRDSLSSLFTLAGYQVTTFQDGAALVLTARVRMPVCILLDICMPGQSGLDILRQLDAANYPAPIFIISGRGDIASAVQAIKNGAYDFIEKGDRREFDCRARGDDARGFAKPPAAGPNARNQMAIFSGPRPAHAPGN